MLVDCAAGIVRKSRERVFADEGFKNKHKGEGDLLMANHGYADNNQSQFAVAMR